MTNIEFLLRKNISEEQVFKQEKVFKIVNNPVFEDLLSTTLSSFEGAKQYLKKLKIAIIR